MVLEKIYCIHLVKVWSLSEEDSFQIELFFKNSTLVSAVGVSISRLSAECLAGLWHCLLMKSLIFPFLCPLLCLQNLCLHWVLEEELFSPVSEIDHNLESSAQRLFLVLFSHETRLCVKKIFSHASLLALQSLLLNHIIRKLSHKGEGLIHRDGISLWGVH